MKNVKIFVELTNSSDLKETEQQLNKISDEIIEQILQEKKMNIPEEKLSNAQIFPYVIEATHDNQGQPTNAYKNLHQIHFPFKVDWRYSFGRSNENLENFLNEKLSDNPDTIIFIGNFMNSPIPKVDSMTNPDTHIILIQTSDNNEIDKLLARNYSINIKELPNLKIESSDTFTSLAKIINPQTEVQDNIKTLRQSFGFHDNVIKLKH